MDEKLVFPVKMEEFFASQKYIVENPVYVIKVLMTGEMEGQSSNGVRNDNQDFPVETSSL